MQEDEKQDKFEISIPKRKNNVPLAYQYQHQDILSLNIESAIKATENNALELSAQIDGNDVLLYSRREKIGILGGNRIDMLKDWIRNNEPYLIYLEGIDTENKKAIVHLAFYRDKREKMSWREHVTIKLTNYKKEDAQMVIPVLENGNELDLNENYSDRSASEYVGVEESYVEIGRLPKKMCERYLEEGAAGCFFDHADYDEEKDVYIPYVTIYW